MTTTCKKRPLRMILFAQDIIRIHQCSSSTASRRMQEVKLHFLKHGHQEVTIKEYCCYYALPYLDTCEFLNLV